MANQGEPSYSQILSGPDYNRMMTYEHLYIAGADSLILNQVLSDSLNPRLGSKNAGNQVRSVVEIGCGSARLLERAQQELRRFMQGQRVRVAAIDHDEVFLEDARKIIDTSRIRLVHGDIRTYKFDEPVDVFYSQGFHHHVTPEDRKKYLSNVSSQLRVGGLYILGDEFLPDYCDEADRQQKAVIWYSHIIAHALKGEFVQLAQAEAETLLDDLSYFDPEAIKTQEQINLILERAPHINMAMGLPPKQWGMPGGMEPENFEKTNQAARALLEELRKMRNIKKSGNPATDLSRGDYKISEMTLMSEIKNTGLEVIGQGRIGPVQDIGGLYVYQLKKS